MQLYLHLSEKFVKEKLVSTNMSSSQRILKVLIWTFLTVCVSAYAKTTAKTNFMPPHPPTLAESINKFAFDLHKALPIEGNLVTSPWSVAFSLAMILLGAQGQTLQQMMSGLSLSRMNVEGVHYGFKQLREHLLRHNSGYEMNMFSTILVQERHDISPVYKLKLQRYYDADIHDVDFARLGGLVTQWMNVWTSLKTAGKITNILSSVPSPDTVMLLLTANYFKGTWDEKFDPNSTRLGMFHNEEGSISEVEFMCKTKNMTAYNGNQLKVEAVDVPMKGHISFLLLKPQVPEDMDLLQRNLSTEFFQELYREMTEELVELWVPKFKASSRVELQQALESLGMRDMFSEEADLTGVSSSGGLAVQEVIHKAALEIDEDGAIATSVTVVTIVSKTQAYKLHFDRPFLFLIRDKQSGTVLFMGRISNLVL